MLKGSSTAFPPVSNARRSSHPGNSFNCASVLSAAPKNPPSRMRKSPRWLNREQQDLRFQSARTLNPSEKRSVRTIARKAQWRGIPSPQVPSTAVETAARTSSITEKVLDVSSFAGRELRKTIIHDSTAAVRISDSGDLNMMGSIN